MTTSESTLEVSRDVPLAPHTTLRIGGPARFYTVARNRDDLLGALQWASEYDHEILILGGGSNMLVSDDGFDGLVIDLELRGVRFEPEGETTLVEAAAGEDWDELVETTVQRGLAGFECLSGIPGRVGATPIQNVGAYGQDVSETIVSVEAWDRQENELVTFSNEECDFGYRASRFKGRDRGRYIILSARYRLRNDGEPAIRYADLEARLIDSGTVDLSLNDVRRTVLEIRRAKGMVLDESDPDSVSAGSFFMNPVIPRSELDAFLLRVKRADVTDEGEHVPQFPAGDDRIKLSAAWLIQHGGFHRGHVHGNVGLSTRHTLAIINRGGGTATEVIELAEMIQRRVERLFGIDLQPEPTFIGFEKH